MGRVGTTREEPAIVDAVESLDAGLLLRWVKEIARSVDEQRDYLTQLDAAIGDADHGVNLRRGFTAVTAKLQGADSMDPGQLLTTVGSTLISTVGGASGPLYGTAFRQAGKALGEGDSFDPEGLGTALRAALVGVQKLGAAAEGDKTMVDALAPAVAAFEDEVRAGRPLGDALRRAREAAEDGMRATVPMQARKGRASYLGPRSVGHQDPGATSTALLFAALERAAAAVP
jgi:dihydroxyacetone kinase phosphoprotein-dependent L subunit